MNNKADIIAQLKKDIWLLGGCKESMAACRIDTGLEVIKEAFPGGVFPLGAVHEFISTGIPGAVASAAFIAAILGRLMNAGGVVLWIRSTNQLFPPALQAFGIQPDHVIFIDTKRQKEALWVMEEGLKCAGLVAVVGEINELTLTTSKRLQLAVEQSRVTGFILRFSPLSKNATSCVTRWNIVPVPSQLPEDIPGVGFPRWKVTLEKVRNGKPGVWDMEWKSGRFQLITKTPFVPEQQQRKAG
jgi:protein ImuA